MSHIKKLVSTRTGKVSFRAHIRTNLKTITKTFKKKSDAVAFVRKIEGSQDIIDALTDPILNQTFTESLEQFIPTGEKQPGIGNDRNFRRRLETFDDLFGELKLNQIKKSHVKQWLDGLDLAPATINRHKNCFGTFAKWVNTHIDGEWNPHKNIPKLPEPEGRKDYLTIQQQQRLLTEAKLIDLDKTWGKMYLLILVALSTGLRRGEVMALDYRDIMWKDRIAIIRAESTGAQKSGYREVPLPMIVIEELLKHRKFSGLIFSNNVTAEDEPDKPFEYKKQWEKCRTNAGLADNFVFHSLRHTTASNLARAGKSLLEIGTILGHKSAQTTLRYSHLVERAALHEITADAMSHLG